jgi:5-formyltetrahydrofolate cyclo-ligase
LSTPETPAEPDQAAERNALRKQMRARRRQLPAADRVIADRAILRRILALPVFRAARHIGVYFAFDGEPALDELMRLAGSRGKHLHAPVITGDTMHFAPVDRRAVLDRNIFGIPEPADAKPFDARRLDLVLTPLVAFDETGTRIGVGRGYYDKAFEFLRHRSSWLRPRLLGVAYGFQCVREPLHRSTWDIPLWGAVTEAQVYRFMTNARHIP